MPSRRSRTLCVSFAVALVALTAPLYPGTSAHATASASCNTFEFIGARGSGEDQGNPKDDLQMGAVAIKGLYDKVAAQASAAGVTIDGYGVAYPAQGIAWNKDSGVTKGQNVANLVTGLTLAFHVNALYDASVKLGIRDASDVIERIKAVNGVCPSTKFILAGYSQGAQVIGGALESLPSKYKPLIEATALFGDPLFNPADVAADRSTFQTDHSGALGIRGIWADTISSPVFSYCHGFDPVCNLDKKTFCLIGLINFDPDCVVAGPGLPGTRIVRDYLNLEATWIATGDPFSQHTNYGANDTSDAAAQIATVAGFANKNHGTAPADIVFVIDSTGSMQDEISDVENNVIQLADTIGSTSSDFRLALVDYKDDPDDDSAYQSQVDVPFTTDTTAFTKGVSNIDVNGGGDTPESMYSGIMAALDLPWRTGVRKTVVVIGDAPGKDPEPVTGYTLKTVIDKAFSIDPGQIYTVPVGDDASATTFMTSVSQAAGGTVTSASTTADFLTSLQSALIQAGSAPHAVVTGPSAAVAGLPTTLSAAGTTNDPSDPVIAYDWNFGTGTPAGSYDATTTTPAVTTTFATSGTYAVAVRVRVQSGLSGLATTPVTVVSPPSAQPGPPARLTAKPGVKSVVLSWAPGSGAAADYYLVEDGNGAVIASFTAGHSKSVVSWTDSGLNAGEYRTYRVVAANSAGASSAAGPVKATTLAAAHGRKVTIGSILLGLAPWLIGGIIVLAAAIVATVVLLRRRGRLAV